MFDIIYAYIKKTIILGKLTIININMVLYKKLNLCSSPLKGDPIPELMEKKEAFWKQVDSAPVGVYKHLYANDEIEKYLMTFQNLLAQVPKWNSVIIECFVTLLMYTVLKKNNINILELKYFKPKEIKSFFAK